MVIFESSPVSPSRWASTPADPQGWHHIQICATASSRLVFHMTWERLLIAKCRNSANWVGILCSHCNKKKMDPKHQHYSRLKLLLRKAPRHLKGKFDGVRKLTLRKLRENDVFCSNSNLKETNRTKCRSHWDWTSFSIQIHQVFAKGGALSQDADSSSKD